MFASHVSGPCCIAGAECVLDTIQARLEELEAKCQPAPARASVAVQCNTLRLQSLHTSAANAVQLTRASQGSKQGWDTRRKNCDAATMLQLQQRIEKLEVRQPCWWSLQFCV